MGIATETKQRKKSKKLSRDKFSVALRSLNRYLETLGWRMVVAGPVQIESNIEDAGSFGLQHYRCVVKFTGGKIQKNG